MDAIYSTQQDQFERTIRIFPDMNAVHAFNKQVEVKRSKKEKPAKGKPEAIAPVEDTTVVEPAPSEVEITEEATPVVEPAPTEVEITEEVAPVEDSAVAPVALMAEVETTTTTKQSSKSTKRTSTKKKSDDIAK